MLTFLYTTEENQIRQQPAEVDMVGIPKMPKSIPKVYQPASNANSQQKEGQWSYTHLIIQLEDCLDVIKGIYRDEYVIHIMVHHSCGHNRQCKDGIDEKNMNVTWMGTSKKCKRQKHPKVVLQT